MKNINELLRELYLSNLPCLKTMYNMLYELTYGEIYKRTSEKDRKFDDFSHPFLLYCWEEYLKSQIKIMVFGQESNSWDPSDRFHKFIESEEDVDALINLYKGKHNHPNNQAFPKYLKHISEKFDLETTNKMTHSIIWNNINKFGLAGDRGHAWPIVTELEMRYFNIIKEEIRILEPDVCIFLTGPNYDKEIMQKFECTDKDLVTIEGFGFKQLIRINSSYLPDHSYRTYHPGYGSHFGNQVWYDPIIDKIVNMANGCENSIQL